MSDNIRIFIGFDTKEPIALHVLMHSILRRASIPVSITPIVQEQLRKAGIYTRERGPTESTEFSMTRFLVPYLSNYVGISVFMDCDMVCLVDLAQLLEEIQGDGFKDVWVCKHDYTPKDTVKFLGQPQTAYPRKNWSSFMLFNCANQACRRLTPEYVNKATGLELHRFKWCEDDRIGSLSLAWNHLVGEYEPAANAKILHYTLGGPWFEDYKESDHAKEWLSERDAMMQPGASTLTLGTIR